MKYKHLQDEFDFKGDHIHCPIHFDYSNINNLSVKLKVQLIDFEYNDYIEELDCYFYGVFFDKPNNEYVIRTHSRNLLLKKNSN